MNMDVNKALNCESANRLLGYEWDELRRKVLARDNYKCRNPSCDNEGTDVDHIIAKILGGTDDLENLQALCSKCHKKKTKDDIEKRRRIRKIKQYKSNFAGGFD